jgi:glycosyltransferase involved in cell wall biosynthesis
MKNSVFKPLISVIVPIYNGISYLRECIESIQRQTYAPLEIILVDDGSTDGSGELCDKYANTDCRIQVIHQKNQGPSGARNTGIDHYTGEYIAFVDGDDKVEPDYLEFLWTQIHNTGANISCCGFYRFYHDSGISRGPRKVYSGILSGEEAMRIALYQRKPLDYSVWNKLFKRELFTKIRFPEGRLFEDLGTVIYLMHLSSRVAYSTIPKYYYRQHSKSILNSAFSEKKLQLLDTAEEILNFIQKNHPSIENAAINTLISASFTITLKATGFSSVYEEYRKRAWNHIKHFRWISLGDIRIRWRNRIAILLSFLGETFLKQVWNRGHYGHT